MTTQEPRGGTELGRERSRLGRAGWPGNPQRFGGLLVFRAELGCCPRGFWGGLLFAGGEGTGPPGPGPPALPHAGARLPPRPPDGSWCSPRARERAAAPRPRERRGAASGVPRAGGVGRAAGGGRSEGVLPPPAPSDRLLLAGGQDHRAARQPGVPRGRPATAAATPPGPPAPLPRRPRGGGDGGSGRPARYLEPAGLRALLPFE